LLDVSRARYRAHAAPYRARLGGLFSPWSLVWSDTAVSFMAKGDHGLCSSLHYREAHSFRGLLLHRRGRSWPLHAHLLGWVPIPGMGKSCAKVLPNAHGPL